MYPTNPNEWQLYDQARIDEGLDFVVSTHEDEEGNSIYASYIDKGILYLCDLETYKPYRMKFSDGTYHEVQKN